MWKPLGIFFSLHRSTADWIHTTFHSLSSVRGSFHTPEVEFIPHQVLTEANFTFSSLQDEISAQRQQAMKSMIDAVHHEIERYSNASICIFGEPLCDATMLGLLLRAFCKIQLKIYPEVSVVTTKSVEEVRFILQTIEFPEYIPILHKPAGCCKYPVVTPTTPTTAPPLQ